MGTLRATDADGDRVWYSTSFTDLFSVDRNTGEVTLQAPLDREVGNLIMITELFFQNSVIFFGPLCVVYNKEINFRLQIFFESAVFMILLLESPF